MNQPLDRMSKADFARLMGWSDTRVSQLAREHRLVLDTDGLVIVERSKALIAATRKSATRGGDRTGKHARIAAERAAAADAMCDGTTPPAAAEQATPLPAGAVPVAMSDLGALSLTDVARAEKVERTRGLRLQNARDAGELVSRANVAAEAFRCARQAQEQLLALRDRLPPLLAAMDDEREIGELLETELRHVIAAIAAAPFMADITQRAA